MGGVGNERKEVTCWLPLSDRNEKGSKERVKKPSWGLFVLGKKSFGLGVSNQVL